MTKLLLTTKASIRSKCLPARTKLEVYVYIYIWPHERRKAHRDTNPAVNGTSWPLDLFLGECPLLRGPSALRTSQIDESSLPPPCLRLKNLASPRLGVDNSAKREDIRHEKLDSPANQYSQHEKDQPPKATDIFVVIKKKGGAAAAQQRIQTQNSTQAGWQHKFAPFRAESIHSNIHLQPLKVEIDQPYQLHCGLSVIMFFIRSCKTRNTWASKEGNPSRPAPSTINVFVPRQSDNGGLWEYLEPSQPGLAGFTLFPRHTQQSTANHFEPAMKQQARVGQVVLEKGRERARGTGGTAAVPDCIMPHRISPRAYLPAAIETVASHQGKAVDVKPFLNRISHTHPHHTHHSKLPDSIFMRKYAMRVLFLFIHGPHA